MLHAARRKVVACSGPDNERRVVSPRPDSTFVRPCPSADVSNVGARVGRLGLMASLVAGRLVAVTLTAGPSHAELTTIRLDQNLGLSEAKEALLVQAAMIAAGSLDPIALRRLFGRPRASERYFALESARATAMFRERLPRSIDALMRLRWDGSLSTSPAASLRWALGTAPVPAVPAHLGVMRTSSAFRASTGGHGKDAPDRSSESSEEAGEDEFSGERSRILEALSAPVALPSVLSSLMKRSRPSKSFVKSDGSSDGAAETVVLGRVRAAGETLASRAGRLTAAATGDAHAPSTAVYPEWDVHRASYREAWCRVEEFDVAPQGETTFDTQDDLLRRRMMGLALSRQRHSRMESGDALDIQGVVEHVIQQKVSGVEDPRIYVGRRPTRRDLAVALLLDASGSGQEQTAVGSSSFLEHARIAAHLTEALTSLDARSALFAFNGTGRSSVRLHHVKGFDEPWDLARRRRLTGLEPTGFTRLGAAVRHAGHLLQRDGGATHRALLVLSDGLPYDDAYEHHYAEADTCKALAEVRSSGIAVLCLTTSFKPEDALARVFGTADYLRLASPSDLAHAIVPLLRGALARAESVTKQDLLNARMPSIPQRRTSQTPKDPS